MQNPPFLHCQQLVLWAGTPGESRRSGGRSATDPFFNI
jgi:hypothetical protein